MKSQKYFIYFLILGFFLGFSPIVRAEGANFLAIPHLATAPTLDGKVDQREWTVAALLPPLAESKDGLVRNSNSRICMGWKDEYLYIGISRRMTPEEIAFFVQPPIDADVKIPVGIISGVIFPEFRLMSKEEIEKEDHYAIAFAASGKASSFEVRISPFGGLLPPSEKKPGEGWNCKTRVAGGNWEAEMQIPLAWIGGMTTPAPTTLAWNQPAKKLLPETLAIQLALSQGDVACRFMGAGQFGRTQGLEIELVNGNTTPFSSPIQIKLLEGGKVFDQLNEKDATVTADGAQKFRLTSPWKCGIFQVAYQVGTEEKPIARGGFTFESDGPMRVNLIPFYLEREGYWVQAETFNLGISSVQWKILDASGGKILAQAALESVGGKQETFVDIKGIPNGSIFQIEAREGEKLLAVYKRIIQHPATLPDWWTKKAGMEPVVPEPFKAIECKEGNGVRKLDFLMGEYDLKESVLPHRIGVRSIHETAQKDLLRGPILLKAKINGKETVVSGSLAVKEAKPEVVLCQSSARVEGLEVLMDGMFEYDGMEKVTLKMAPPKGGAVGLEGLWLEIPMKKEYSDLVVGLGELAGAGPWVVPKAGVKLPFREVVSLGDEERRLVWFAENYKGWKWDAQSAKEAIEFVREADGAITLKINLVKTAVPFQLEKEREIVFGLMFTPVKTLYPKPIRHGWMNSSFEMLEQARKTSGEESVEAQYGIWEPAKSSVLWGWPEISLSDAVQQQRIKLAEDIHRVGMKNIPYVAWGLPRKSLVYPLFGAEMVTDPILDIGWGSVAGCWNTPFQDVFISLLKDRVLDAKIDGYRMDAGFADVFRCNSLVHRGYGSQCGWVDDEGKEQGSMPIFSARKAAERGYRLFHGGVHPDGLCMQGRVPGKCPPVWSFFDGSISSEGIDVPIKTIKELPLEFYRSVLGDAYGVVQIYWPKSHITGGDSRLGIALIHNFMPRGTGVLPSHEVSYSRCAYPVAPAWKLVGDWMKWPDPKIEFWGYWKNGKYVQTSSEDLKSSFYVRRGERMLLSAMNLERKPMEGTIKINLAELGFKKQAYAQDGVTGEEVAIEDGVMKLTFLPEGYRLIKITPEKPAPGLPEKSGDNLFPEFDLSTLKLENLPAGWSGDSNLMKVENGILELNDGASLRKASPLTPGGPYVLEIEARVECEDGAMLGPSIVTDCLRAAVYAGGARREGTIASQMVPGQYETMRVILDKPADSISLELKMKGKGKALIRKIGLYPIKPYIPPYEVN